jgi:integrase
MAKVVINHRNMICLDGYVNGKRKRVSTKTKATDKRALKYYKKNADEEFKKLVGNSEQKQQTISFREYGEYVLELTKANRKERTQKESITIFNNLCKFFNMDLSDIKVSHILEWQKSCELSPKTVRNYRGVLGIILKHAFYDDIISKNPNEFAQYPSKEVKTVEFHTVEEIKKLILTAEGQFKNIVEFNFFAGLRGSELIALRWNDIDFKRRTVRIDTAIVDGVEDVPKNRQIRYLDMLPQMENALRRQQGTKEFVFVNRFKNGHNSTNGINEMFKKLCKEANIKVLTFHSTRRSANTMFKQLGFNQNWILKQIGHMDNAVNQIHYTGDIKINSDDLEKIVTL